tara:strand:+ start:402 stop:1073 length:672 start_codon:yes stop_codon:yes gene_type:complete
MKNIWFFGDSFTRGDGCIAENESPYYDDFPNERQKLWTTLVSEKVNMVENNQGESGCSSDWIINTIVDNLYKIKRGDIVVFSDTRPTRYLIPRIQDNEIHCFSPGQESIWDWHIKNRKGTFQPKGWEEMKKTLIDFTWFFQEDYKELWEEYYLERFNNFKKYFDTIGVKSYFWSYKLWYEKKLDIELICDDKPEIHNEHFSWKGHKQFADYILKEINKNKNLL